MRLLKTLKKAVAVAALGVGVAIAGCGDDGTTNEDAGRRVDAAYGPPNCDTDQDCIERTSWYNYCDNGRCSRIDKDGGPRD